MAHVMRVMRLDTPRRKLAQKRRDVLRRRGQPALPVGQLLARGRPRQKRALPSRSRRRQVGQLVNHPMPLSSERLGIKCRTQPLHVRRLSRLEGPRARKVQPLDLRPRFWGRRIATLRFQRQNDPRMTLRNRTVPQMLFSSVKRRGGGPRAHVAAAQGPIRGIKFTAKDRNGSPSEYVYPLIKDAFLFRRQTTASIFM